MLADQDWGACLLAQGKIGGDCVNRWLQCSTLTPKPDPQPPTTHLETAGPAAPMSLDPLVRGANIWQALLVGGGGGGKGGGDLCD